MEPRVLSFDVPAGEPSSRPHRMAWYEWGDPGAARTVICVHGLTRNGRDFDELAAALADRYRVLSPDMPGRGRSEWLRDPAGYAYPAYIADIGFAFASLGITQVDWIGTSMGGILGMMAAAAIPGLVRSLALNDVGALVSAEGLKRIAAYAGENTDYASREEAEASLRSRCAAFGIPGDAQWRHVFAHGIEATGDGRFRLTCDPRIGVAFAAPGEIKDIDLWMLWEGVARVPLLVIRGESSDILSRSTVETMQARHPHMTYHEVAGAGHAPSLMRADDIAFIRDWLARV